MVHLPSVKADGGFAEPVDAVTARLRILGYDEFFSHPIPGAQTEVWRSVALRVMGEWQGYDEQARSLRIGQALAESMKSHLGLYFYRRIETLTRDLDEFQTASSSSDSPTPRPPFVRELRLLMDEYRRTAGLVTDIQAYRFRFLAELRKQSTYYPADLRNRERYEIVQIRIQEETRRLEEILGTLGPDDVISPELRSALTSPLGVLRTCLEIIQKDSMELAAWPLTAQLDPQFETAQTENLQLALGNFWNEAKKDDSWLMPLRKQIIEHLALLPAVSFWDVIKNASTVRNLRIGSVTGLLSAVSGSVVPHLAPVAGVLGFLGSLAFSVRPDLRALFLNERTRLGLAWDTFYDDLAKSFLKLDPRQDAQLYIELKRALCSASLE